MNPSTFTRDELVAAITARGTPPHMIAAAAGVGRHIVEAACEGDLSAMTADEFGRVGCVLGLGSRVLEVPADRATPNRQRVLEAARRVVADDLRAQVHSPRAAWVETARRAGVDVERSYGIGTASTQRSTSTGPRMIGPA